MVHVGTLGPRRDAIRYALVENQGLESTAFSPASDKGPAPKQRVYVRYLLYLDSRSGMLIVFLYDRP